MKRISACLALFATAGTFLVAGAREARSAEPQPEPALLDKAPALPLALTDDFEFRKVLIYNHDLQSQPGVIGAPAKKSTTVESLVFEEKYRNFGAVTSLDRKERKGHYFDFFWRASRPANITIRLEYRQQRTGPYIQARELSYDNASGDFKTQFSVVGDTIEWQGPITSWRAILIEDGKIVALHSSYLWN